MKYELIVSLLIFFIFSCAKKTVPTASTDIKVGETIKSPDETKIATSVNNETAVVAAGHEIFTAKCGRCHDLVKPEKHTATRWVGIMESMAPKAKLNETEKANVLAYVQFYAANAK